MKGPPQPSISANMGKRVQGKKTMGSKSRAKKIRREAEITVAAQLITAGPTAAGAGPIKGKISASKLIETASLGLASILAYWFLTARLAGITVSVLIDEYVYVLDAHYKAFTESGYPNHLFQLVYSVTKACGPDFYACARGVNASFVVGSALVIYQLVLHISHNRLFGAVAWAVAIFGTFGTYTAYFMPEAIFNFMMVLFIYLLIRFGDTDRLLAWLGLGVILGITALAKPHALFVVPAFVIYIFISSWSKRPFFIKTSLLRVGALLSALVTSKLTIGYLIAGPNGFSLFGSYGYAVSSGGAVAETLGENTWLKVPEAAFGQTLMIVLIFGLALPVALLGLMRSLRLEETGAIYYRFQALFGIALLNMMAVTALFEAWQGLETWMHTRYYSYLIPLAVVVLIAEFVKPETRKIGVDKWAVTFVFLIACGYLVFMRPLPFSGNWVDAPDLRTHLDNTFFSLFVTLLGIALAFWWLKNSKVPIALAIILSLGSSVFSGIHISNYLVETFGRGDLSEEVGRLIADYLPETERDRMIVAGDAPVNLQRTLFFSRSGKAILQNEPIDKNSAAQIAQAGNWLLVFGSNTPTWATPHLQGLGYTLFSPKSEVSDLPDKTEVFSFSDPCIAVESSEWVCGEKTSIQVQSGFPVRAVVDLILDVSDGATEGEIEFRVGESYGTVKLSQGRTAISFTFHNLDSQDALDISFKPNASEEATKLEKFVRVVSVHVR